MGTMEVQHPARIETVINHRLAYLFEVIKVGGNSYLDSKSQIDKSRNY